VGSWCQGHNGGLGRVGGKVREKKDKSSTGETKAIRGAGKRGDVVSVNITLSH